MVARATSMLRPRRRRWGGGLAAIVTASGVLASPPCHAEPQANASLTIGGAGVGYEGRFWEGAEMHLGVRGDVLFGREHVTDFGVGPYVELGTFAFDELQFGGGASVLMPVNPHFPLVASVGPIGRWSDYDEYGLEPGISGALFWGSRSFNFHANYVMAGGLLLEYRHTFGESQESALMIGLQLDLAFIGLPLVMLLDTMRGPSEETRPIEPLE